MEKEKTNNRQKLAAILAVIENNKHAKELSMYLSEKEAKVFEKVVESYLSINNEDLDDRLKAELSSLIALDKWSGLGEIHPAWILEELKTESPRIIGIILRYLPSKHVRYIIEHLPPTIRYLIPNIVEAFSVPDDILSIIKARFESKFQTLRVSKSPNAFEFDQLYYLKENELEVFFKDLGLEELAMALQGLPTEALNVILNRLSIEDAKSLNFRINDIQKVSNSLKRQAKFTILEVEDKKLGVTDFLLEIGIAAFARAIMPSNALLSRFLSMKLAPKISYILRHYVDRQISKNIHTVVQERQSLILGRIVSLAKENLIDTSWARFAI